jgi:uncharacterized delta-60 repeat protein
MRQSRTRKIRLIIRPAINLFIIFPALLSAQVDTAWVRRYNLPGNWHDEAHALTLDSSGNVYVTGASGGPVLFTDYATIKYYPNGDTAWVRRYNGPGHNYDDANAIAVDNIGNVYVTGSSMGSGSDYDYATIKYYSNGDTAWIQRYNGPGNVLDYANALVIDDSGNVYVTGESHGVSSHNDYATIKYYPNGDTAWIRRYDGPGNGYDVAEDMAIDDSGNVYVTGTSGGAEIYTDYATIKYHANGDTAWIRRYNGPLNYWDDAKAIVVDNLGYVYVTGASTGTDSSFDYATIKYDSNGDTIWVKRYSGPEYNDAVASSLTIDNLGNVYVTGESYDNDYTTIKYYPNGDTAWVRRYNGPGDDWDDAEGIAVDNSGNVYVTGFSYDSSSRTDYATIKYYPNGDTAWVRRYNGPGNGYDWAYAIAVDNGGNVHVTGMSLGVDTDDDYLTIKYSPTGEIDENISRRTSPGLKFDIFPNPARNYCTIRFAQPIGHSTIRIYDVTGKKIKEITNRDHSSENRIFLTGSAPGVYFVRVGNGSTVGKIIITK